MHVPLDLARSIKCVQEALYFVKRLARPPQP